MGTFYTVWSKCRKIGQCLGLFALCLISAAPKQATERLAFTGSRGPANYIPNDDVIVVPIDAEMTFYDKHFLNDANWSDKSSVQRQIRIWQENELMAQQYGFDTQSPGAYYVPNSDEKWAWMQRSYFRYIKRKGEAPLKDAPKNMWREWTANDEVNSIDEMEATFRATSRTGAGGKALPSAIQEKQIAAPTQKFRFYFQPRVEQGLLILRAKHAWFDARAWLGVNGESEFNIQRSIASTRTRLMVNYYGHSGEYLSSLDQHVYGNISARATSSWKPEQLDPSLRNDQLFQLNYSREF